MLFDAACNRAIKFILHTNFPGHYDYTDYHRCPFNLTLGRPDRPGLFEISPAAPRESGQMDKVAGTLASAHITSSTVNTNPINQNPNPMPTNNQPPPKSNNNKNKKKNNGNNNNNNNNNGKGKNQNNSENKTQQSQPSDLPLLGLLDDTTTGPVDPTMMMCTKLSSAHSMEKAKNIGINWDTRWDDIRHFLCQDKVERSRLERPVVLTRSSASNPFGPSLCYGVQDMIFEVMSNDHLASVTLYYYYEDSPA